MVWIDIILENSGTPIYQQIMDQIKGAILRGELQSDHALPSIRMLARELQISVITTKRAYDELEKAGFLYTIPGKGSFVADHGEHKLEESKHRLAEEKLKAAIDEARLMGLNKAQLSTIFERLMEGE